MFMSPGSPGQVSGPVHKAAQAASLLCVACALLLLIFPGSMMGRLLP
jgi:hypothetical protein